MTIQVDTREKPQAIKNIMATFEANNVKVIRSKCYVGDYVSLDNPRVAVDRKQNLSEVCSNCVQEHKRFADELKRAQEAGIHMIILVEHSKTVKTLEDVAKWKNPRLSVSPMAVSGERLYKIMKTMGEHYDAEWQFCSKEETGKRIIELLEEQK